MIGNLYRLDVRSPDDRDDRIRHLLSCFLPHRVLLPQRRCVFRLLSLRVSRPPPCPDVPASGTRSRNWRRVGDRLVGTVQGRAVDGFEHGRNLPFRADLRHVLGTVVPPIDVLDLQTEPAIALGTHRPASMTSAPVPPAGMVARRRVRKDISCRWLCWAWFRTAERQGRNKTSGQAISKCHSQFGKNCCSHFP